MHGQLKWIVALIAFVIGVTLLAGQSHQDSGFELVPKIVFSSNRTHPTCTPPVTALSSF